MLCVGLSPLRFAGEKGGGPCSVDGISGRLRGLIRHSPNARYVTLVFRVGDGAGAGGNTRTHALTCSVSDSRRSGCSRARGQVAQRGVEAAGDGGGALVAVVALVLFDDVDLLLLAEPASILNQYQGGMCISGRLTMTERTPRHLISPLAPIHRRYECRGVLKG